MEETTGEPGNFKRKGLSPEEIKENEKFTS